MASTSSFGHAQFENKDPNALVCKCQERKPLPSAKLCEKYGGASAADGCQESRQSSSSLRACGICECHVDRGGNVSAFVDEPASSLSDHLQEIPNVGSTTSTVMEQSSMLVSMSTWLVGYMRHICGLLACLAACVPSIRLNEHDEADQWNMDVDHKLELVCSADGSDTADSEHNLEPKHKIFLSHSGAQKDFVEQLCVDLEQCDRYPFFDKRRSSLPIGEKFPKLIFDAIEQCRVGVVVLSEQYFTRSKWPMLELNAMVKELDKPDSSIRIIPVYYLISLEALKDEKNHRRWMSKWKGWAFKDKRINVTEWYKSIRILGSLTSLVAKGGNGDVKLRKRIVTEICQLVPPDLELDDSFIQGRARILKVFEERMDEVCTSASVGMIGLFGMGGIGKTTICKALCKHLRNRFRDDVCHIELGSSTEMKSLQEALKRFPEIRHDIVDSMADVEQGVAYFKKKMRGHRVFFALDNVQDDSKSIEGAQAYLSANYGAGSIVVVTARSLDVLKKLHLDETQCLEMPDLEEDDARALFLNNACVPTRNEVSEDLVGACIDRCHFLKSNGSSRHYHPLALKVLGQQLGQESWMWARQLSKIDTFNQSGDMNHPVFSILRTSFDSLKYEHQLIVMDVALFSPYVGMPSDLHNILEWLCMMHEESAEDMKHLLGILKRKSLLEDLDGGFTKIGMHDLWREFVVAETISKDFRDRHCVYQVDARSAVRRSGRWRENVQRLGFVNEGWKGLRGLNLDGFVNVEAFRLQVDGWMEDCELELDLRGWKHLKSLQVDTSSELTLMLNGLSSLSSLGHLMWGGTLGLSPCIAEIRCLTNLQVLVLAECDGVQVVDVSELKLLRVMGIFVFPDLITVRGLSSRLVTLRFLAIAKCKSLRECAGVGEVDALEVLNLGGCGKLEELPCLGHLSNLRELNIGGCKSLRAVAGLSDLVALEMFHAQGCLELATLPDLAMLTKLRVMDIRDCPVQGLPSLEGLVSLTRLYAFLGKLWGELPDLSQLAALKGLQIYGWDGPICTSIRNLLMMEALHLCDCKGEEVMPDLLKLKGLKRVQLWRCEYRDLSGLSNSTVLETLWVDHCHKLERLPKFERLTKLTTLSLMDCNNIRDWPSESTLCSLHTLQVDGSSLTRLGRELETLPGLRNLTLFGGGCENVLSMALLMSRLELLRVILFSKLEVLDVSNFCQLRELKVLYCHGIRRVTCSKPLAALTELEVRDCESLVEMPDLSMFQRLVKLSLKKCGAIKRLSCSKTVTCMKMIELISCDSLVEMPDVSMFPSLENFHRCDG